MQPSYSLKSLKESMRLNCHIRNLLASYAIYRELSFQNTCIMLSNYVGNGMHSLYGSIEVLGVTTDSIAPIRRDPEEKHLILLKLICIIDQKIISSIQSDSKDQHFGGDFRNLIMLVFYLRQEIIKIGIIGCGSFCNLGYIQVWLIVEVVGSHRPGSQ